MPVIEEEPEIIIIPEVVEEEEVEQVIEMEEQPALPYVEQLKLLSREELERRLEQHFQTQFLEELRHELERRNLTSRNNNGDVVDVGVPPDYESASLSQEIVL